MLWGTRAHLRKTGACSGHTSACPDAPAARPGLSGGCTGGPGECPGLSRTCPGSSRACPRAPEAYPSLSRACLGVPGACPGVPRERHGAPTACPGWFAACTNLSGACLVRWEHASVRPDHAPVGQIGHTSDRESGHTKQCIHGVINHEQCSPTVQGDHAMAQKCLNYQMSTQTRNCAGQKSIMLSISCCFLDRSTAKPKFKKAWSDRVSVL